MATVFAAVLGLFGLMGVGHLYMRKYVIGVVLLLLGAFLALFSLSAIMLVFEPSEFPVSTRVVTAVLLSVPFILLYIWQVFNAPKPARPKKVRECYDNYAPPYGP
jgi:hypothetical protein